MEEFSGTKRSSKGFLILLAALAASQYGPYPANKPNVIVIMVDDMGNRGTERSASRLLGDYWDGSVQGSLEVELSQEFVVVAEEDSQSLGDGEDYLAVGDVFEQLTGAETN